MSGGTLRAGGRLALREPGQSTLEAELEQLDLRRMPGAKGARLPSGRATLRLAAAFPGMQWDQAELKASTVLRLAPEKRGTGNSTIQGVFTGRLRGSRMQMDIDSIAGYGVKMRGTLGIDIRNQSLSGQIRGTARSLSQLVRGLETGLGVRPDSQLTWVPDGRAEYRATLSGSTRNPRAVFDFTAADLSAGRVTGARLALQGGYGDSLLRIEQARLEWRNQAVTASGEIGLGSATAPLRFEAEMENASAADILEGLGLKRTFKRGRCPAQRRRHPLQPQVDSGIEAGNHGIRGAAGPAGG